MKNLSLRLGCIRVNNSSWRTRCLRVFSQAFVTDFSYHGNTMYYFLYILIAAVTKSFSADPTEHHDISNQHPDVVANMKKKLEKYKESLVPANFPAAEPKSNPKHFKGNWSPGWC